MATLIISKLPPAAQESFERITRIDYTVAFLIGAVGTVSMVIYLTMVAGGLRRGRVYTGAQLARARRDTLLLGQRCALLCLGLWIVSGLVVPITLEVSGSQVPWNTIVHFTASQLVCGAIAVVYPFFFVNFYAVRCLYPVFLRHGEISASDARMLKRLGRRSTFFLAAAAAVPLLGIAGATFIPPEDLPRVIVALRVLCVGSVIAFVAAYWMFRMLSEDRWSASCPVRRGTSDQAEPLNVSHSSETLSTTINDAATQAATVVAVALRWTPIRSRLDVIRTSGITANGMHRLRTT